MKLKKYFVSCNRALMLSFLCFLTLGTMISCGTVEPDGNITLTDHRTPDFNQIKLDGRFRAFYVNADSSYVSVETYENVAENLKIKVDDKTLTIKEKRPTENVDFYNVTIYSKNPLESVMLEKSAELNISSEIKTDHFKLQLKNNAKFIGSLRSNTADIDMSQKSRANLRGESRHATLKIVDTASIIAPYWNINTADVLAGNGSYTELQVNDTLRGAVKNSAEFIFYHDPVQALKISKSTTVQQRKLN